MALIRYEIPEIASIRKELLSKATPADLERIKKAPMHLTHALGQRQSEFTDAHDEALEPSEEVRKLGDYKYQPEIDDFWDKLPPAEINRRLWEGVFSSSEVTLEDLHPYRIRVMYRIVREFANLLGFVQPDQTLFDALYDKKKDPYHQFDVRPFNINKDIPRTNKQIQVQVILSEPIRLPLLPPPVPEDCIRDGVIEEWYHPNDDRHLANYLRAFKIAARYLNIEGKYTNDPEQGKKGMIGMSDPELIRFLCPALMDILHWEEKLVEVTTDIISQTTHLETKKRIRQEYGLTGREIDQLVSLAKYKLAEDRAGDSEEERAYQLSQVDGLIIRARDACDIRTELRAMQVRAQISGISKIDAPNDGSGWSDIAKNDITLTEVDPRDELPEKAGDLEEGGGYDLDV